MFHPFEASLRWHRFRSNFVRCRGRCCQILQQQHSFPAHLEIKKRPGVGLHGRLCRRMSLGREGGDSGFSGMSCAENDMSRVEDTGATIATT